MQEQPPSTKSEDPRDRNFAKIPNHVLDCNLKPHTKLVLCGLIRCAYGKKSISEISQLGLSKRVRMDRKKIREALRHLESLGIIEAVDEGKRGKTIYRLHLEESRFKGESPHVKRGEVPTSPREVLPTNKTVRAEDNNKTVSDAPLNPEANAEPGGPTDEMVLPKAATKTRDVGYGPHITERPQAARCAQHGPLKGLSAEEIQHRGLAPNGTSFYQVACEGDSEAWLTANKARKLAGGEDFNPGSLQAAIDAHGEANVWFAAKWFPSKLASRKTPPDKPAPYFLKWLEEGARVKTAWLAKTFSRHCHARLTEEQQQQMPSSDSPVEWAAFMQKFDWTLDDIPRDAKRNLNEAVIRGDATVISLLTPESGSIDDAFPFGLNDVSPAKSDDSFPF